MSQFEFVFALYALMLGLSLVELLGGLARAIEARLQPPEPGERAIRIGWLTPMLGVFVLLDLLSFWSAAWLVRDQVAVSARALLATTMFTSGYFLAAYLVFPRDPVRTGDLDAHYFRVRRIVLGALLLLLACQWGYYASLPALAAVLARPLTLGLTLVLIVLMAVAMIVPGRRASMAVLAALIARYLVVYLI